MYVCLDTFSFSVALSFGSCSPRFFHTSLLSSSLYVSHFFSKIFLSPGSGSHSLPFRPPRPLGGARGRGGGRSALGAAGRRGPGGGALASCEGSSPARRRPLAPPRGPAPLGAQARGGARGRVPGRTRAEGPPSPGTRGGGAPPSASSRPPRRRGRSSSLLLLLLPPPSPPPPPPPPASPRPPRSSGSGRRRGSGRGNKSGGGGSGGSSARSSVSGPPRSAAAIRPLGSGSRGWEPRVPLGHSDTALPARSSPRSRVRARPARPALPRPSRPA